MRRRQVIGGLGLALSSGCLARATGQATYRPTDYEFVGLTVTTRPSASTLQPFDATVTVRVDDETVHEESVTVADTTDGVVARIHEGLKPHETYTLTVSTPHHDPQTMATDELERGIEDRFDGKPILYDFWLTETAITVHPVVVTDDWPA